MRGNYKSGVCAPDNKFKRGHCKSGVPDNEQDEVFGVPVRKGPSFAGEAFEVLRSAVRNGQIVGDEPFEGLGAKHFEGLAASGSRHVTFESLGSAGVNNSEFVRRDNSACFVYSPTERRRGGVGIHTCYVGPTPVFGGRQPYPDVGIAPPNTFVSSTGTRRGWSKRGVEHTRLAQALFP